MSKMSNRINTKSKIVKEEVVYNFKKEEMILRDFLAADRTLLANERTLLAYIRTGISLLAIAISLIKLFVTSNLSSGSSSSINVTDGT